LPRLHDINRNWVVDAISNPVVGSGGSLVVNSTQLQIVDDAYPISVSGLTTATLQVVAELAQSHNFPGGSLSATLAPNAYVLNVYQSEAGTLVPSSGTLAGVTLFVLEHGS
jgi:hypothetical protein